ncbi:ImmA/IrrE family metallo-endopeptidase [Lactobacillus helveticus]|uniref:ImmA/IrrE family metallo-endopeptidase n=1 Tax=Lactobacillus helveticus TaxID=1587 RepID=UPI0021A2606B|nr:ImmA/IrrE family metallo-endopeptidase [Lactobacillus helveticus]MCT3401231.1 ImmA/IrrE family metallo-endopeptidase [Lactobacillus helveticus]
MSYRIKQLLNKYHLTLIYQEMKSKGYIVRTPTTYPDFLFVKDGLSDEETEKVILHEIGHAEKDDETQHDYLRNRITRLTCESSAKSFAIREQIKKYVDLGNDVCNANWLSIANYLGTQDYFLVQEELSKYKFKE